MLQLNEFIKRGLILIERGPMTFVKEPNSNRVTIRATAKLLLRDQEYISQLEKENEEMRATIRKMMECYTSPIPERGGK